MSGLKAFESIRGTISGESTLRPIPLRPTNSSRVIKRTAQTEMW